MNPLIVTFVSEPYIPVGRNWFKIICALNMGIEIQIVALDEATALAFPDSVVMFRPVQCESLSGLWLHRTVVLRELLEQGHDIIHSDADAIWLQNPFPSIQSCGTEMVFSQGTVWPPDVHARRGIVVCCGFFYMKNTPAVRDFMGKVERQGVIELEENQRFDDQETMNRLIDRNLNRWVASGGSYPIEFRNLEFTASRSTIMGETLAGPSVSILPHHQFPRIVEAVGPEVVVAHPISGKTCADKRSIFSALGLWHL